MPTFEARTLETSGTLWCPVVDRQYLGPEATRRVGGGSDGRGA